MLNSCLHAFGWSPDRATQATAPTCWPQSVCSWSSDKSDVLRRVRPSPNRTIVSPRALLSTEWFEFISEIKLFFLNTMIVARFALYPIPISASTNTIIQTAAGSRKGLKWKKWINLSLIKNEKGKEIFTITCKLSAAYFFLALPCFF